MSIAVIAMQGVGARLRQASDTLQWWLGRANSVRLTFAYDKEGLRLIDRTRRMKPPPDSDPIEGDPGESAIVVELHSASGVLLYRQRLHDPIRQDVEIVDPKAGLRRERFAPPKGSFSAVVPNLDEAREVVVSAGPKVDLAQFKRPRGARGKPYVLGRFAFRGDGR